MASAWACAAMLRYPCGPPSQRHQISGAPFPSVRSSVIPASANREGRDRGLPGMSWVASARLLMIVLVASVATRGHQSSRPKSAWPSDSNDAQLSCDGASNSRARPSSPSP